MNESKQIKNESNLTDKKSSPTYGARKQRRSNNDTRARSDQRVHWCKNVYLVYKFTKRYVFLDIIFDKNKISTSMCNN